MALCIKLVTFYLYRHSSPYFTSKPKKTKSNAHPQNQMTINTILYKVSIIITYNDLSIHRHGSCQQVQTWSACRQFCLR